MRYIFIKSNNLMENADDIMSYINNIESTKSILLNLTQENRFLEIALGLEDLIIYNSYDYIKGTCDLEKALLYTEDKIDLVPSTIKKENISLLFDQFINDLNTLIETEEVEEEYENAFVIFSDPLRLSYNLSPEESEFIDFENPSTVEEAKKTGLFDKILKFLGMKKDE